MPDLVVEFDEAVPGVEVDTCTIKYTVTNVGKGPAGGSQTLVQLDSGASATESTPALAPGASVSLSTVLPGGGFGCPFDPDLQGVLTADPDNHLAESDEDNNVTPFTVLG